GGRRSRSDAARAPADELPPEREAEAGSLADPALCPDATAVTIDDALNRGEPDARALEVVLRVKPLKDVEQLRGVGHVEAGAVVVDEVYGLSALVCRAELDACAPALSRELPRIAEQVVHDRAEQRGVPFFVEPVVDDELHRAVRLRLLES